MILKKAVSFILAASMLSGLTTAVLAEDESLALYGGKGEISVKADPTISNKGNVFFINGSQTKRGTDKEKGVNPYIEIPESYLYDEKDGTYTMKKEWSVSFDWYGLSQGFRYAFYTGTDDVNGKGMTGIYFFPDSGSTAIAEGLVKDEKKFTQGGEYVSTKKEWHNYCIEWKNESLTVYKDGEEYIQTKGGGYAYSLDRKPITRLGYTPYVTDPGAYAYVDNIIVKNGETELINDTADSQYTEITELPPEPDPIVVNTDISDGSETQKLIDNRPDIQRRVENLDRGLIAVSAEAYGFISWRWLGTESADTKYNLYKNGEKLNDEPMNKTSYVDYDGKIGDKYAVTAVIDGTEGEKCKETELLADRYLSIPIDKPEGGKVTFYDGKEEEYGYRANDASTADLDGDGELEIILKWDPTNSRDSAHSGPTGSTIFDAYKLDGTKLWRIDLGINVRSGAHDTQFLCSDFNNDGKAEVAMRTSDGTKDGVGKAIGDAQKDWRDSKSGKNITGPLYITVFDGVTGAEIDTVDFYPQTTGEKDGVKWDVNSWGDDWGNRSERYNACVFYENGVTPSMCFGRGYYDKTVLTAYSMKDNKIATDWIFDTDLIKDKDEANKYKGKGNHSMATADIDYDGKDELISGALVLDDDGTVMYAIDGAQHGDAQHTGDLIPERPGLETFSVHEWGTYGHHMRDARTGELIWYSPKGDIDVGRGASDDIDPTHLGAESWSSMTMLIASDGKLITNRYSIPANSFAWWDGDLGREVQDGVNISKYNPYTYRVENIEIFADCHSNNAAKSNPSLTADILGDWREEAIYPTLDDSELRIYTTIIPTGYKIPALMTDTLYRDAVAVQNVGYNQPTHVSYNLGYDTKAIPVPQIYTVDFDGNEVRNPDLSKKEWGIDTLYEGDVVNLAIGEPKALVGGAPYYIDSNDNTTAPYIKNDRTMVPMRFIAEAFGAYVTWDAQKRQVRIQNTDTDLLLTVDSTDYTLNGKSNTTDAAAEIKNDRTFVPIRMVAESMNKKVDYNANGIIVISDKSVEVDSDKTLETIKTVKAMQPKSDIKYAKGEKMSMTQTNPVQVLVSEGDGEAAYDLDYDTVWKTNGKGIMMMETDTSPTSAVIIKFADNEKHRFKVYTHWGLSDADKSDITNLDGWEKQLETESDGSTDAITYIFPVPKYTNAIKLELLDDTPCEITEIGTIGVQ